MRAKARTADVPLLDWIAKCLWKLDVGGVRSIYAGRRALQRVLEARFEAEGWRDRAAAARALDQLRSEGLAAAPEDGVARS